MTLTWLVVGVGTGQQPSRNCPNVLNKPEDVLKQYGLAYEEKNIT